MAPLNTFKRLDFKFKPEFDFMQIEPNKGSITFTVNSINFIDKDTKQFVIYIPSFDISSYGSTKEKAEEMLKHSVDDFCNYLIKLSFNDVKIELRRLGWKNDILHKKEFSNSHIDINGNLREFNAVDNKVTIAKLEAA